MEPDNIDRCDKSATVHDVFKRVAVFQRHQVEEPEEATVLAVVTWLEIFPTCESEMLAVEELYW